MSGYHSERCKLNTTDSRMNLFHDMNVNTRAIFNNKASADLIPDLGEREMFVHRNIVAARSSMVANKLASHGDVDDKKCGVIRLKLPKIDSPMKHTKEQLLSAEAYFEQYLKRLRNRSSLHRPAGSGLLYRPNFELNAVAEYQSSMRRRTGRGTRRVQPPQLADVFLRLKSRTR